jgi:uncharacterized protein YbjT (DUF2867 family)
MIITAIEGTAMRVGLIGGTGFVGSDLVGRLVELGHVP